MPSSLPASEFDSIPDTIEAFANGNFIVVVDDPGRENEGDLIIAADAVSTEQMAFLIRHSSGIVCAPLLPKRADRLGLPDMVLRNEDQRGTAYTVTVDAADPSVTTGISAHDRALVSRVLASSSSAKDLKRPGHILPLRARPGGVRERNGHTEAAVDFCRLTGKPRVAVISELVDDGDEVPGVARRSGAGMLRGPGCIAFARTWGLKVCTIADLATYLDKTYPRGAAFPGPQEDEE